MNNKWSEALSCPSCHQLVHMHGRYCPHCQADMALSAVVVEPKLDIALEIENVPPLNLEVLVPRLGQYLLEQNLIQPIELQNALKYQQELTNAGDDTFLGQVLIRMGYLDQKTLDYVITQKIFELKSVLEHSNRQLVQRVQTHTTELQNALGKLTELNQLKADFIASVSRELTTPIQFLTNYLDLLMNEHLGPLTTEQTQALNASQLAVERLGQLIQDLLQFSSATMGHFPLHLTTTSMDMIVNTAVNLSRPKAQSRRIALHTKMYKNIPPVQVDDEKITWVLEQFLDNAIKFTPPGGDVEVVTAVKQQAVTISVTDTGIGISSEQIDDIFKPFHRLDRDVSQNGGIGLGLALAQRIIEAHGSIIEVTSQPRIGSSFTFSLPIAV